MSNQATADCDGNRLPMFFVDANGCWIWTRSVNFNGYGQWSKRGPDQNRMAHTVIWETFNGPLPDGLEMDHLCRVRPCVNPAHLEAVTRTLNNRRSTTPTALNFLKTSCIHGHVFDRENTIIKRRGRDCRACKYKEQNERRRRITAEKREQAGEK